MLFSHFAGDKLADKKISGVCTDILSGLAEALSPGFVLRRVASLFIGSLGGASEGSGITLVVSPIAHQVFLEWCSSVVNDFGIPQIVKSSGNSVLQFLVSIVLSEIDHKVAAVRTAAVEVCLQYVQWILLTIS